MKNLTDYLFEKLKIEEQCAETFRGAWIAAAKRAYAAEEELASTKRILRTYEYWPECCNNGFPTRDGALRVEILEQQYRFLDPFEGTQKGDEYYDYYEQLWKQITWPSINSGKRRRKIDQPQYRMLEEGEMLQEGDEYLFPGTDTWLPIVKFYPALKHQQYRRPLNPPEQHYRSLEVGEIVKAGDEYFDDGEWKQLILINFPCSGHIQYRRPIPKA